MANLFPIVQFSLLQTEWIDFESDIYNWVQIL